MSRNEDPNKFGPVGECIMNIIGAVFVIIMLIGFNCMAASIGVTREDRAWRDDAVKHGVAEYFLRPDHTVGWRWLK